MGTTRKLPALALVVAVSAASYTAALAADRAPAPPPPAYRVIVNSANHTPNLDRKFLADAFLKKTTRWSSGEVIRPVDQQPSSPVRRAFSEAVLQRPVDAVKSYWQQVIFSGRDIPPPELDTDQDVVKYVVKHAGAVGYVSGTADVASVKVVTVK